MVKRALIHQLIDGERHMPQGVPVQRPSQGIVVWIAGLPGSGKARIAEMLQTRLASRDERVVLLDGNTLRELFGNNAVPTATTPLDIARNNARLAQMLAQQGQNVICTSGALRLQVYDWNRKNLPNYVEVFLDVPSDSTSGAGDDLRDAQKGNHQIVDVPPAADLHVTSDSSVAPEEVCDEIVSYLKSTLFV